MFRGRGRGRGNVSKVSKSNHVIQCIQFSNLALFKGDTYTYRGLFKRNGGEYSRDYYGYIVSLDVVEKIKNELTPMLSGFIIQTRSEELPITLVQNTQNLVDDDNDDDTNKLAQSKTVQFSEPYENTTSNNFVI